MALKISLKPREKILINGSVIQNGPIKAELTIENNVPILRQQNIITADEANSPSLRIYLSVQLMYIDSVNESEHQKLYWNLVKDFAQAAPSSLSIIDRMNEMIFQGNYYQALKIARELIVFEQEVTKRVTQCD
jgi:flagellar protein FlbT